MTSPDVTPTITTPNIVTTDAVTLPADLAMPAACRAAAIVCHPHPQYGGNRFNNVVSALFEALPAAGIAALRFDFRSEFGGGVAELLDAQAAVAALKADAPGVPIVAVGYSFGAMVTLGMPSTELVAKALIAPPLSAMETPSSPDATDDAHDPIPTLVISPVHDQFTPPDAAAAAVAEWSQPQADATTLASIEMADHFMNGRAAAAADQVIAWLDEQLAGS